MGLLALMLMLATPSFAQKKSSLDVKAKKTTAFEQANMRAEFYKQHPAMAKAPKTLKKDNSGLAKTVVGRLRAQQKSSTLKAGDGTALMGKSSPKSQSPSASSPPPRIPSASIPSTRNTST